MSRPVLTERQLNAIGAALELSAMRGRGLSPFTRDLLEEALEAYEVLRAQLRAPPVVDQAPYTAPIK